jgi:hypothetical protein
MATSSQKPGVIRDFVYPLNAYSVQGYYFVDDAGGEFTTSYKDFLGALPFCSHSTSSRVVLAVNQSNLALFDGPSER